MKSIKINREIVLSVCKISLSVALLDQITKLLVLKYIPLYTRVEIIQGFFNLTHVRNPGVAFGMLQNFGSNYQFISLAVISAITLFLLFVILTQTKQDDKLQSASLSLILGGAVGNLIDRFRLGEVVDFISVHWQSLYYWPSFNIADAAISIGIVLFLFDELFLKKSFKKTEK